MNFTCDSSFSLYSAQGLTALSKTLLFVWPGHEEAHSLNHRDVTQVTLPKTWQACVSDIVALRAVQQCIKKAVWEQQSKKEIDLILIDFCNATFDEQGDIALMQQLLISLYNQAYRVEMLGFKTRNQLSKIDFGAVLKNDEAIKQYQPHHQKVLDITQGMILARSLADLPSDVATPRYYADVLAQYAKQHQLSFSALHGDELKTHQLNAIYSVGKGSRNPPCLVELRYTGAESDPTQFVFVGKGVTFDSGGLWLKMGDGMYTMKYDMCGAAVLIGLLDAVRRQKLPLNVTIILGLTENMLSEYAMRPGDIIRMHSGLTVEVNNTDAEGRLVLADLLSYASQYNARYVIDTATLTGAVVKALGYDITGIMGNNQPLQDALFEASRQTQDRVWALPLDDTFEKQTSSEIADLCNTPPNNAAIAVSAGYFLSHFIKQKAWCHLDIAGTAMQREKCVSASGRPIPLLFQFLENHSQTH